MTFIDCSTGCTFLHRVASSIEGDFVEAAERLGEMGPPSSVRGSPVLRPCAECGHRTESVTLGPSTGTLALCHLCAWTVQREHAERQQTG